MLTKIPRAAVLAILAGPLFAHAEGHGRGVFTASAASVGFLHPFMGWDHLLAMVTVGILGATSAGGHRFALPATFLGAMTAGALVAGLGVPLVGAEWVLASSVLLLGACLAYARVPIQAVYGVVAAAALVHGHAHLAEMPDGAGVWSYGAGMLAATALLHGAGLLTGFGLRRWAPTQALQITGGAIATGGAVLLGMLALG